MAKRGIKANDPDFDNESLRGKSSKVGFLGVPAAFNAGALARIVMLVGIVTACIVVGRAYVFS